MGVLVCYDDFTYDVVNDYHLDYLIDTGCIIGFDRSGNWVKVDDEVRSATVYTDPMVAGRKDSNY